MAETVRDELTQLAGSIRALEQQLEVALAKRRVELNYVVHDGIVRFEHVMITKHRLLKARLLSYILGDRKSTRLNSSHLVISYAVFCLKKKKIKRRSINLNCVVRVVIGAVRSSGVRPLRTGSMHIAHRRPP